MEREESSRVDVLSCKGVRDYLMAKLNDAAWFSLVPAFFLLIISTPSVQAQTATATITAGTAPYTVAVNPITNKIYVANQTSDDVTVIDGATNATTTVAAGNGPAPWRSTRSRT